MITINNILSKQIYSSLVSNITEDPTAKTKFVIKYDEEMWKKACLNIYLTSIDSYSRHFQYKIIHQYLAVNSNLYKWKLSDSPRCSYCAIDLETIDNLFFDCYLTQSLYLNIKQWCDTFNLILPNRNAKSILYGIVPTGTDNPIINTLILLHKQFVFNCKEKPKTLIFTMYKLKVKQFEYIESVISHKNGKYSSHLEKWAKYYSAVE